MPSGGRGRVLWLAGRPSVLDTPAMLDIKQIRENPDVIRTRLASRGAGEGDAVSRILELDEIRRKGLVQVEALKSQRNKASKEIGALMGQKKLEEAEARKRETRELGDQIAALDAEVAAADAERDGLLLASYWPRSQARDNQSLALANSVLRYLMSGRDLPP